MHEWYDMPTEALYMNHVREMPGKLVIVNLVSGLDTSFSLAQKERANPLHPSCDSNPNLFLGIH